AHFDQVLETAQAPTRPRTRDPIAAQVEAFYKQDHDRIQKARRSRRYFYNYLTRVLRARVPPGQRVLDVGCASGAFLAALEPSGGVGIDLSGRAVEEARRRHGSAALTFIQG